MGVLFIIYTDLESLLEKTNTCYNNAERSSAAKIDSHHLLVIHCLHTVHLIQQKTSMIIIGAKIEWKTFAKI